MGLLTPPGHATANAGRLLRPRGRRYAPMAPKGTNGRGGGLRVLGGAAHLRLEPVPWLRGRHQAEGGEAGQVVLEGWRAAGKGKPLGGRISSNTWIIHSAPKPTTPPHVAAAVISLLPGKNLCGNTWASGQQAGYSTVRVGTVGSGQQLERQIGATAGVQERQRRNEPCPAGEEHRETEPRQGTGIVMAVRYALRRGWPEEGNPKLSQSLWQQRRFAHRVDEALGGSEARHRGVLWVCNETSI